MTPHTRHEKSLIVCLSDSCLPKIIWYKTYASVDKTRYLFRSLEAAFIKYLLTYDLSVNTK